MEEWQQNYIIKNLPKLLILTNFNSHVEAALLSNSIISQADVESLHADHNQNGTFHSSTQYYRLLLGRTGAYQILTKALVQNNQTGAVRVLVEGVINENISKPLTYMGISTTLDGFENTEIELHGKIHKLSEFFPAANYENLKQMFKDTLPELEIYDTFVTKQRTFVLVKNTIPPNPILYIPRFLSNQIKFDKSIFKIDSSDVLVFKNTIARYELSEIARPHLTSSSNSQLFRITCRFIYLDEYEDWIDLKKSAKVPIHLIKYDTDKDEFLLEDSTATSDIIRTLSSKQQRAYIPEVDFVKHQLSSNTKASSVCICDTPGMGKTFLISSIARSMTKNCTGRIIGYIQLKTFAIELFSSFSNDSLSHEILPIFKYISPSQQHANLILKLLKARILQGDIFFDGFDDIPSDKVDQTIQVLQILTKELPNVRIYITSRPHMTQELENTLGVIAYNILPFNLQNQIDCLIQTWSQAAPSTDLTLLRLYASNCLEEVNHLLNSSDQKIARIPLLCHFIAEVAFCTNTGRIHRKFRFKLYKMYQTLIQQSIDIAAENREELNDIKLTHIRHALELIFPNNDFQKDEVDKSLDCLMISPKILNVGIIHQHPHTALEFIHRSFAEYLVAEFFLTKLLDNEREQTSETTCESEMLLTLNSILKCSRSLFLNSVVVFFVDLAFAEADISEKQASKVAPFCASILPRDLHLIFCNCCRHNLFYVFALLKQALLKCSTNKIRQILTARNRTALIVICIVNSNTQMFQSCAKLFDEPQEYNNHFSQCTTNSENSMLLKWAVNYVNYEAVEYFADRIPLKGQNILLECVKNSYNHDSDIVKKENILHFLLSKDPSLIYETWNILVSTCIHLKLIKILVKFGADLNAEKRWENVALYVTRYMTPIQYHEFIRFILTDSRAEHLFHENGKWKECVRIIIREFPNLPETLELLLKIPGIDINMRDEFNENLLFSTARANKLTSLKKLVDFGLDFKARGKLDASLLHVAAECGNVEMVQYMLLLKLDPNSSDKYNETPLHYVFKHDVNLSVIDILVENGANIRSKNLEGQTVLHLFANHFLYTTTSNEEIVKYFVRKGLGLNDRNKNGNTPLYLCRYKEVMKCMVELGADIHAENKYGITPAESTPE